MNNKRDIPEKTVERLALYRRLLQELMLKGLDHIYSHQLAELVHNTPSQVRRDLMIIGYEGKRQRGYEIEALIEQIGTILGDTSKQMIALIGIGNLGRALLAYLSYHHARLSVAAAFDTDDTQVNRVIAGCRCYPLSVFKEKVKETGISLAIITVPAQHAQTVADLVCGNNIKGILNFAPIPLKVPNDVYVENIDIIATMEKISFFANKK